MKDLIVGIHSVQAALNNPDRSGHELICTEDGKKALHVKDCTLIGKHQFQEEAKKIYKKIGFEYQRVPSGAMLLTSELEIKDVNYLYDQAIQSDKIKILCLDGVTDVHNAGALIRTACFYGVAIVLVSGRQAFSKTPSFYRIASGATEYIDIVQVQSLPKTISKLIEMGIDVYALSEHESENLDPSKSLKKCMILGSEEKGISHAIMRLCENKVSLKSQGEIKSLNVSVAGAVAMEKLFS